MEKYKKVLNKIFTTTKNKINNNKHGNSISRQREVWRATGKERLKSGWERRKQEGTIGSEPTCIPVENVSRFQILRQGHKIFENGLPKIHFESPSEIVLIAIFFQKAHPRYTLFHFCPFGPKMGCEFFFRPKWAVNFLPHRLRFLQLCQHETRSVGACQMLYCSVASPLHILHIV